MHSSLKENDVTRRTIIAGHSVCLPYAISSAQLIQKLKEGEQVNKEFWFRSDDEARKCGFKGNASVARMNNSDEHTLELIYELVDEALCQAQLSKEALVGDNVRVYMTGTGPRIDGKNYKQFYNNNDIEDIKCSKTIMHMHAKNMSQDFIAHSLAHHYKLHYLPPNIHSTSNSSLVAVYLGSHAIEHTHVDLAIIINCSKIKTQDIWFLEKQSMLNSKWVQPFGENCNSVLFAEGFCVMVLENEHHARARNIKRYVYLKSAYKQISANRSNDPSWMSINMQRLMSEILTKANICANDLCAIIPHGNGSLVSDKAEENAIISLMAGLRIPVLAYKGQIGYTATGSGIIDLIIGEHSLLRRELLSPVGQIAITKTFSRYVVMNKGVVKHRKKHLLKTGIGMDGSILAVVLTANSLGEPEI